MQRWFTAGILALILAEGCPVHAQQATVPQAIEISLDAAKMLRPLVLKSSVPQLSKDLMDRYGFSKLSRGYRISAGQNPNVIYQQARPFPETDIQGLVPFAPLSSSNDGIKFVGASRSVWVWPPPNPRGIPPEEKQVLWRWEPPEALQRHWWSEAGGNGSDRYWSVCLYTHKEAAAPDPQLFYFDTLSGLKWKASIPVKQTLQSLAAAPDKAVMYDQHRANVFTAMSADGSRIFVLVSRPDKQMSLLFLYNQKGTLLKTLNFPNCEALPSGIHPNWQLPRRPPGQMFVLTFRQTLPSSQDERAAQRGGISQPTPPPTDEAFLADMEGNVIARFVNEAGKPVKLWQISETHGLAYEQQPDGTYRQLLYTLP